MNNNCVSPETPAAGLTAVREYMRALDKSAPTFWRWRKKGIIAEPININGKLYLRREDIEEFERRAIAGEFSYIKPPFRKGKSK